MAVPHHARLHVQASRAAGMLSSVETMLRISHEASYPSTLPKTAWESGEEWKIYQRKREREREKKPVWKQKGSGKRSCATAPNQFFGVF